MMIDNKLSLVSGKMSLCCDFIAKAHRIKKSNLQRELIVRAAKPGAYEGKEGPGIAIDATAGLGEDSLLLAASGFRVIMYERDPVIAELLRDGMRRAEEDSSAGVELSEAIKRMELIEGDSVSALGTLDYMPDVILLDPMFPIRQKSSLVKKKLQMIQALERPCENEDELLNAAIQASPHRIIIKRPVKGPYLADRKPSFSLEGKAVRIDCIVI